MRYDDRLNNDELGAYVRSLNSRARNVRRPGTLTTANLRERILDSGGMCEWCGISLVLQPFEMDHILSLQAGGDNTPANIAIACPTCNRRKSAKHPARWAAEIYAETGRRTALIHRILTEHDVTPSVQRGLFDDSDEDEQNRPFNPGESPYKWR